MQNRDNEQAGAGFEDYSEDYQAMRDAEAERFATLRNDPAGPPRPRELNVGGLVKFQDWQRFEAMPANARPNWTDYITELQVKYAEAKN